MSTPQMDDAVRLARTILPNRKLDLVIDTDTFNEVDDQFALTYALLSPERINVQAVYAAPFLNDRSTCAGDGMRKSYDEILRLLGLFPRPVQVPVLRGSECFLRDSKEPFVDSPAARDLVARALAWEGDDPLYVVALGAITNIASALRIAPEIIHKICVIWLGGHAPHWPNTREFNLHQDIPAARVVLDSACPFILVPCPMVTT